MNRRIQSGCWSSAVALLVIFLLQAPASGQILQGQVVEVAGDEAKIRIVGGKLPNPGDRVQIYQKLAAIGDEGEVARGEVTRLEKGFVWARCKPSSKDSEVLKGDLARVFLTKTSKTTGIIDTHMHVWSGDPARFPLAHPYDPKFKPPKIAATLELLLKEMDEFGVDHCVLVQTISHGWDNRYVAECLKAHPRRFRAQGLIDPTDPKVADKLEYWVRKHGFSGMRFSPMYYQGKDDWLNAKSSEPLWKKAEELGAIFSFFIASPQLPKLEDMIRRFPKVRVVIDHLARVDLKAKDPQPEVNKLLALAKYSNVWVKVSELSVLSPSGKYPYKDTFGLVKQVYDAFGPDRLLFGTGFPGATRAQAGRPTLREELDLVRKEIPFFAGADREKILGGNAAKLWGFETGKRAAK